MATMPAVARPADPIASGPRVVLADDSETVRWLATHVLARAGITEVSAVPDGPAALALVEAEQPDCVVLDVQMPGMGGFEVLAELKRRCPEVPVVMLSGFTDDTIASRALAEGASAYLDKTNHLLRLHEAIRAAMEAPAVPAPTEVPSAPSDRVEPSPAAPSADVAPAADRLRQFEYAVSHDLAAPLRAISGFASLLQRRSGDSLDATSSSFVEHIVASSRQMQLMMDDLLVYTRAGATRPALQPVPVGEVVDLVLSRLDDKIRAQAVEVSVGELPMALGDPDLIATVLGHLLENAMIFNTSTPPTVTITGGGQDSTVYVVVSDNGIGMDPARVERAFELFGRLGGDDGRPGTGTGLALCRRLMDLQNGTITIETSPGKGTVVTVTFPAPNAQQERS